MCVYVFQLSDSQFTNSRAPQHSTSVDRAVGGVRGLSHHHPTALGPGHQDAKSQSFSELSNHCVAAFSAQSTASTISVSTSLKATAPYSNP